MTAAAWLIVGLGNPGPRYANTRHNVGYRVLSELSRRAGESFRFHRTGRADVIETRFGGPGLDSPRVILGRARTYMNESGGPVAALAKFYSVTPDHLIVIHDELDVAFGSLRAKFGGGDNGHNGLRSIRSHLGTGEFYRIRVGVGRPPGRQNPADYVLSDYARAQREELGVQLQLAADAVEVLVADGLAATQQRFNS